jgi:hypothetical protein
MAAVSKLPVNPTSGFSLDSIKWIHLEGSPRFDYPIDYWVAVLGAQPDKGRIDFLSKWAPNSYCHFHRHIGETTTLVLEGEQHIVETTSTQTIHKVRKPGFYANTPGNEVHMEYGGPEGAVVFFSCQADNGHLFEVLDKDENVLAVATIEGFLSGKLR